MKQYEDGYNGICNDMNENLYKTFTITMYICALHVSMIFGCKSDVQAMAKYKFIQYNPQKYCSA